MRISEDIPHHWVKRGMMRSWEPIEPAPKPSIVERIGGAFKGKGTKPTTPLAKLIAEGAATKAELQKLDTPMGRRLTAKAFVAASLAMPGAMKQEAEKLLAAVERPENSALLPSFRRLYGRILDLNSSSPWSKLGGFVDADGANACARMQCHEQSLFAAAAIAAARDRPDAFGTNTSMEGLKKRTEELVARIADIQRRIEASWQRADVTLAPSTEDNRKKGLIRLTLDCTNGAVAVGDDMGEAAVSWWMQRYPA